MISQVVRYILFIAITFYHLSSPLEARQNIEMNRFTLSVQPEKEWKTTADKENQTVSFENRKKMHGFTIMVKEIDALDRYGSFHSERWVADSYRRLEETDMNVRGVMKGMYELLDIEKFEVTVADKDLYAMTYKLYEELVIGHGYLYLYFPDFKDSNKFYIFLYYQFYPSDERGIVNLEKFHSVIRGFKLKQGDTE